MLSGYTGKRFDFICRELLWILNSRGELPFKFTEIGRHWGYYREEGVRNVYEMDIVALNRGRKKALFGECKWKNKPVNGEKLLEELKRKVELSNWKGESYYLLVARKVKKIPDGLMVLDEGRIRQILEKRKICKDSVNLPSVSSHAPQRGFS